MKINVIKLVAEAQQIEKAMMVWATGTAIKYKIKKNM